MPLNIGIEQLNNYIDRLQADASPRTLNMSGGDVEVGVLQIAAHLNSMRLGAGLPDVGFMGNLKSRMLAEAAGGTNLAR
jgi:hypothetical protein